MLFRSACDQTPAQAAAPSVAKIPADQAYALAAKGTGFSVGPLMAAHTAYVFFDTTCPHCAHLWQALQPLASQVRVVWMPVGYLQPKSLTQGVTILSATDPKAAMAENEQRLLARQGGITPASTLNEDLVQKVKANTALFMQISGTSGTFGSGSAITLNTWQHVAVVRNGSTFTGYVNGDRKSTRLNSSHIPLSRMPSSA